MRRFTTAAALALFLALLPAGPADAAGTTASAVSANIVSALSISNTVGLMFGQIVPSVVLGTVTIGTDGSRSSSGGVTLANGATPTASSFAVTGSVANTYAITLPTTINMTGPGVDMIVDGFGSNPTATGTLSGAGTGTLLVGATLHVGVSQAGGVYAGTFNVTVAYN